MTKEIPGQGNLFDQQDTTELTTPEAPKVLGPDEARNLGAAPVAETHIPGLESPVEDRLEPSAPPEQPTHYPGPAETVKSQYINVNGRPVRRVTMGDRYVDIRVVETPGRGNSNTDEFNRAVEILEQGGGQKAIKKSRRPSQGRPRRSARW